MTLEGRTSVTDAGRNIATVRALAREHRAREFDDRVYQLELEAVRRGERPYTYRNR